MASSTGSHMATPMPESAPRSAKRRETLSRLSVSMLRARCREGEGRGANLNLPLAPGTGDDVWLAAVDRLTSFGDGAKSMVVSLGVDAWKDDPDSPLQVSVEGYTRAGSLLGAMAIPTVIVQEGGYDLGALGRLVAGFLEGFERGQ